MTMTRRDYDDDFDDFFRREYRGIVKHVMYAGATLDPNPRLAR